MIFADISRIVETALYLIIVSDTVWTLTCEYCKIILFLILKIYPHVSFLFITHVQSKTCHSPKHNNTPYSVQNANISSVSTHSINKSYVDKIKQQNKIISLTEFQNPRENSRCNISLSRRKFIKHLFLWSSTNNRES